MANEVRAIPARLRLIQVLLVNKGEAQIQLSGVHDRLCKPLDANVTVAERKLVCPSVGRQIFVRDAREEFDGPFLEHIEGLSAQNDELHAIRRVVLGMELDKLVSNIDPIGFWDRLEHF